MDTGTTLSGLRSELEQLGAKPEHVRRIFRAWMHLGGWEASHAHNYPKALESRLPDIRARLQALTSVLPIQSKEAESLKLVIGLKDGECVEAVLLPRDGVCVSTQVGCAVQCQFCMTGKSGLIRHLGSAEIVAEVAEALKLRPSLKKVVFMGMGEPSHNLKNVVEAVEFLGNVVGLAHKEIVVSTVGDKRLFEILPTLSVKPALALSLHTTDDALRRTLLPKAPQMNVKELLEATLQYAEATKYPAQIEWTLIQGVTDKKEDVERLASYVKGRYAMVNFIAVNPGANPGFKRPERSHMEDLITILRREGIVATVRDSAAQDIEGGCGQLRVKALKEGMKHDSTQTKI